MASRTCLDVFHSYVSDPRAMNEREPLLCRHELRSAENDCDAMKLIFKTQWNSFGSKWKRVRGKGAGKEMITCGIFRLDLLKFYLFVFYLPAAQSRRAILCCLWSK